MIAHADRVLRRFETGAVLLSCAALFTMMVITVVDVVMRYFFQAPLGWAQELIRLYLLPLAFFGAVSKTMAVNGHIRVSVIDRYVSRRFMAVTAVVGYLVGIGLIGFLFKESVITTWDAYDGDLRLPGVVLWPTWTFLVMVPVGLGLLWLRLLVRSLQITVLAARSDFDDIDELEAEAELEETDLAAHPDLADHTDHTDLDGRTPDQPMARPAPRRPTRSAEVE